MKRTQTNAFFFLITTLVLIMACASGYNKHADQYYEEGMLFYERMEYERAIESFDKVLELAPYGKDNNIVYYNRGMASLKSRQYEKSAYDFTKALELTSSWDKTLKFDLLMNRGNAYQKSEKFDLAVKDYTGAIQLIPEHKDIKFIYTNRAWVWFAKGDYDNAIDDFGKAIKIDSGLDDAYYGRATVWFKKGDSQRALIDAKEAVKLKPTKGEYDNLLYDIRSSMKK